MGYAIDPMQQRWTALQASLLLGSVWAVWHFIPLLQLGRFLFWLAGWCVSTLALRILIVWLYNNTGGSVFATILFHTMFNLSTFLFPNRGSHYDPWVTGSILAILATIVTILWGPRTLARYRFALLGDPSICASTVMRIEKSKIRKRSALPRSSVRRGRRPPSGGFSTA